MHTATFGTLSAARDLEAAGIERRQAEAIAEGMRRAAGADRGELATKAGLAGVCAEFGTIRWAIGLLTAFMFAIDLRVFAIPVTDTARRTPP